MSHHGCKLHFVYSFMAWVAIAPFVREIKHGVDIFCLMNEELTYLISMLDLNWVIKEMH